MAGFVQVTGNATVSATQATIPVPVANAASAGNTLIGVAKGSLGAVASSASDTKGNTWTVDVTGTISDGPNVAVIRSVLTASLTTGDTITVQMSAGNGFNISAIICEYDGAYSTADVTYGASDASSVTSHTFTASDETSQAGELVVAGIGVSGTTDEAQGFGLSAATPPMTIRAQSPSSPGICNAAFADGTAAGLVTPSASWTWPAAAEPVGVLASYVTPVTQVSEPPFAYPMRRV